MKIICKNKKAFFDYFIEEKIESGISLLGAEVKSLRLGNASLNDSYVGKDAKGMVIYNFNIPTYSHSVKDKKHDPLRNKRLLIKKSQIESISSKMQKKGFSIVPLIVLQYGNCLDKR